MRTFSTGATRDDEGDKLDYEGFLSPRVLRHYAEYMHTHRKQADGELRASDNWQKGIPLDTYMKSLLRHVVSAWEAHREGPEKVAESLYGVLFNTMGYLYEITLEDGGAEYESLPYHQPFIPDEEQ